MNLKIVELFVYPTQLEVIDDLCQCAERLKSSGCPSDKPMRTGHLIISPHDGTVVVALGITDFTPAQILVLTQRKLGLTSQLSPVGALYFVPKTNHGRVSGEVEFWIEAFEELPLTQKPMELSGINLQQLSCYLEDRINDYVERFHPYR